MQADVLPLIVFDLDCDFRLGLAFRGLDVGLDDVILPAHRNSLRKLTSLVRHKLPLGFLAGGSPDLDGNAGSRAGVRSPNGSDDQGVVFGCGLLLRFTNRQMERYSDQSATACKPQPQARTMSKRGLATPVRQTTAHATLLPLRPQLPLRRRSLRPRRGLAAGAQSQPLRNPCRTRGRRRLHPRPPRPLRSPDRSRIQDKSPWPASSNLHSANALMRITAPSTLLYLESLAPSVK